MDPYSLNLQQGQQGAQQSAQQYVQVAYVPALGQAVPVQAALVAQPVQYVAPAVFHIADPSLAAAAAAAGGPAYSAAPQVLASYPTAAATAAAQPPQPSHDSGYYPQHPQQQQHSSVPGPAYEQAPNPHGCQEPYLLAAPQQQQQQPRPMYRVAHEQYGSSPPHGGHPPHHGGLATEGGPAGAAGRAGGGLRPGRSSGDDRRLQSDAATQQEPTADRWYLPAKPLPLPPGFTPPADSSSGSSSKRYDLSRLSHKQLLRAADKHNLEQLGTSDPTKDTLRGIEGSARLRPGSQPAQAFSLGLVPADSPYAKAWRGIKRSLKAGDPASKRQDTGAGGASRGPGRPPGSAAQGPGGLAGQGSLRGGQQQQQQQQQLTPDQQRWRRKLGEYLGRRVELPSLAPEAPPLDLRALWLQVMALGGAAAVSSSDGWGELADKLQHNSSLAGSLSTVYDCLLQPLEQELPPGFRPARAIDFMEGRAKQRAAMGGRLGSHAGLLHALQQAELALQLLAKLQQPPLPPPPHQQQQQQQELERGGDARGTAKLAEEEGAAGQEDQRAGGAAGGVAGAAADEEQAQQLLSAAPVPAASAPAPVQVPVSPPPPPPPPPPAAAAAGPGAGSGTQQLGKVPAVVLATMQLLRSAAVCPVEAAQQAQQWGWRPDPCPERAAVCRKEFDKAQGGRKRQGEAGEASDAAEEEAGQEEAAADPRVGEGAGLPEEDQHGGAEEAEQQADEEEGHEAEEGQQQQGPQEQEDNEQEQGEPKPAGVGSDHGSERHAEGDPEGAAAAAAANCPSRKRSRPGDAETDEHGPAQLKGRGKLAAGGPGSESGGLAAEGVSTDAQGAPAEDPTQQQQQQQQEPQGALKQGSSKPGKHKASATSEAEQHWRRLPPEAWLAHVARWLLLSKRALWAGPPGCGKPPLRLALTVQPDGRHAAAGFAAAAVAAAADWLPAAAGRQAGRRGSSDGGAHKPAGVGAKRVFKGLTPKCGTCHHCRNPQLKKACQTNRDRIAQGLEPIISGS